MGQLFRNAAIGVKVALAPAFAILCLLVVAAAGWAMNRSITAELDHVGTDGVARIVDAQAMAVQLTELHQRVYQSLTWEAVGQRAEMIKTLDEALVKELAAYGKAVDGLAGDDTLAPEQRATAAEFAKGFATYAKSAVDTLDIKSAGVATATSYVVTLDLEYKRNAELIRKFVQREQAITATSVDSARADSARHAVVTGAVTLLALTASVVLTLLLTRAITQPLGQAAGMAGRLAEGDLTARQHDASADATGRVVAALGEVSRNLSGMVADIRATAEQIDSASSEIATGNADLSSRTESTASALQQAAAAVEQLAATIRTSAEHARDANAMARNASDVAREGGTMVADVVSTMEAINVQAKKIGEIIGTIDGIAFQTNILALNAAVEAARAGEHGRGFSVVASEVRLLAQRSGEAAREIRSLISNSVEQIDAGTGKVHAAGQTMGRIVGAIEQVADTVDGIARAAAEQASGIAQVNQTVAEMDRNTQQNAAMVEEATAAAASLRQQAAHLVQSIARFRTA